MSSHHALRIAQVAASRAPNRPEHKRFKSLLTRIDAERQRLADWQTGVQAFAKAHAERVQPERDNLVAAQRDWALELEVIATRPALRAHAQTLADRICELCAQLLSAGPPDEELKALYDRFAETDFDTEAAQQAEHVRQMVEASTGLDLGGEPVQNMDELLARLQASRGQIDAAQAALDEGAQEQRPRKPRQPNAAQRRAQQDAERATQSVREAYRKLAAALHPDRTPPDAPDDERQRRLGLMQRTNAAYEANDLLALLALQLETEQIDADQVARVATAQVRHFNAVLSAQLRDLEAEVDARESAFCETYRHLPMTRLNPKRLGGVLEQLLQDTRRAGHDLRREQAALRGTLPTARRYLKQLAKAYQAEDALFSRHPLDDDPFDDDELPF